MTNKKRSIAWAIPHDKLQEIIDESSSMVEILNKIGLNAYNVAGHERIERSPSDLESEYAAGTPMTYKLNSTQQQ